MGLNISGDFNKESDVDILFVNNDKKLVGKFCREILIVSGKDVNPVIYDRFKFKKELKNKEPFLGSILYDIKSRAIIK